MPKAKVGRNERGEMKEPKLLLAQDFSGVGDYFSLQEAGEIIKLRPLKITDLNKTYLNWLNNPDVVRFTEMRYKKWTMKDIKNYYKEVKKSSGIFLAILCDNKHIGNIKIRLDYPHPAHKIGVLGIFIGDKNYWGRGIGTEAVKLATKYAFNKYHLYKIITCMYSVNKASIRVLQKAGYIIEGIHKKECLFEGKYVDCVYMGIWRK